MHLHEGNFTLMSETDVAELADLILTEVGPAPVVFIDTLNQSAPGSDENSSSDMGRLIGNANQLADSVQGLVILIHHSGKDQPRGMRGHSSLFAAMDVVIEVISESGTRRWQVTKSKDTEGGAEGVV
jgi:RecA-family ATPase